MISYSRVDQPQVRALVSLLTASLRDVERAVFWDEQFDPGEPWFEQLKAHIDASPQLFVFWCAHARTSPEVRREFRYALEKKKRVVPVLLDDTPLADELAAIHGIDLRSAVRHGQAPHRSIAVGIGTMVAAALFAFVYTLSFRSAPHAPASIGPADSPLPPPLPPPTPSRPVAALILAIVFALAFAIVAAVRRRKRQKFIVREFARHLPQS